jgi:arylsulfatase A-like enzyme
LGWLVAGVLAILGASAAGWWALRPAAPSGPNLLLITIDTLRADRVGAYGAATGATPVLDALAGRGVRFDEAQTAVPLTGPSHATILTGLCPPTASAATSSSRSAIGIRRWRRW